MNSLVGSQRQKESPRFLRTEWSRGAQPWYSSCEWCTRVSHRKKEERTTPKGDAAILRFLAGRDHRDRLGSIQELEESGQ